MRSGCKQKSFYVIGSYVNNNLVKDENVLYEITYHWIIFCNLRALFTLFIASIIDKYTDEFAITNKRMIIKTGLIRRKTFEMNLAKIESVSVNQPVLGRVFGYGTIIIIGTEESREMFSRIRKPLEFRKKVKE